MVIVWPSYLADGSGESRNFMYLLEQPRVDGPGSVSTLKMM